MSLLGFVVDPIPLIIIVIALSAGFHLYRRSSHQASKDVKSLRKELTSLKRSTNQVNNKSACLDGILFLSKDKSYH